METWDNSRWDNLWELLSLEAPDLKKWKTAGFDSPLEALEWRNEEFTPQEALKWKNEGFKPKKASEWKNKGFTLEKALKWRALGVSPETAMLLESEGIFPEDINEWIKAGFSISLAIKFIRAGFRSPLQALQALEELKGKFNSLQEALSELIKNNQEAWNIIYKYRDNYYNNSFNM